MPKAVRGLDLKNLENLTADEVSGMHAFYQQAHGGSHPGLDFWIENGSAQLKRYRLFTDIGVQGLYESNRYVTGFSFIPYYAIMGYERGVRYMVHTRQRLGLTKAQVMEGIAIAFLVVGPAGMETIARALADYEWVEPEQPAIFPEGWAPDNDGLRSGIDFSAEVMSADELALLEGWFRQKVGEIPPYVPFLGRHRPNLLKAARNRWENSIQTLPKQVLPTTLLHYEVIRGFGEGIRENVLLARAFGVSKEITLNTIFSGLINAGTAGASIVQGAAGDIFDTWQD